MQRYPVPAALPEAPHCSETVVRRSRFLAQCARAASPAQARAFVEAVRRRWPDATHNCWAFAAGAPGDTARIGSSDDGEPHGTAGRPMLQVLLHSGVGEICVVVTRWFGGVKLGTGGLVRAYQDAVRENLAGLPCVERVPQAVADVVLDYARLDALRRQLPGLEAVVEREDYAERARLRLHLPAERADALKATLAAVSNGGASLELVEEVPAAPE
ncbi:YigZ family protein [Desulfovibrio sp.]|uniref:YigZ family protein n=1 Tax=Desulfovibrio sp. TaxID=885 RepID=UPI0023CB0572|nr:YigZ family protein [Desulfovibrio sp.]MDE7241571.1 YigZ family protein [Desulfovibrio sp.]